MANFGKSFSRELGKNTGKWVSNKVFGDGHATPHKIIQQRQVQQRHKERIAAKEYHNHQKELESQRRANEKELKKLAKEEAEAQKRLMISNNLAEVEEHNKYIEVVQSVHKDYSDFVDWNDIANQSEPKLEEEPAELNTLFISLIEKDIKEKIEAYKADFEFSTGKKIFDKLFKGKYEFASKLLFKEDYLNEQRLQSNILETEQSKDQKLENYIEYQQEKRDEYLEEMDRYNELAHVAEGVLNKDYNAFTYAIKMFDPFQDLEEYGSDLSFSNSNNQICVDFYVHGDDVLPKNVKKVMRKGLEIKDEPLTKSRFNEIYQDYVCSCVLRIAKEAFLLLPIDTILINAKGNVLNSGTGHLEEKTIVSVLISREILDGMNFDLLDPSDSMANFEHRMKFKKTEGFKPVEELQIA